MNKKLLVQGEGTERRGPCGRALVTVGCQAGRTARELGCSVGQEGPRVGPWVTGPTLGSWQAHLTGALLKVSSLLLEVAHL